MSNIPNFPAAGDDNKCEHNVSLNDDCDWCERRMASERIIYERHKQLTEKNQKLKEELDFYKREFETCAEARIHFQDDLKEYYRKVEKLKEELEREKKIHNDIFDSWVAFKNKNEKLQQENWRLREKIKMLTEALEFYASAFRIKYNGGISYSPITEDQGKRARETLAKLHTSEGKSTNEG